MSRILLVTGGSKGIGLATARLFLEKGFTVINLSRTASPLSAVRHLSVDFAENGWEDSVSGQLQASLNGAEEIALVHSAGLLCKGGVAQLDASQLRASLEVNVVAPSILNRLVLPLMKPGSSIIYIGSTLSEKAVANTAAYVVAKHALAGLMRSTCQDLAGTGIHTACVCPGFTETEMMLEHIGNCPEILQSIAESVTQKRLIQPAEMANMIYYCSQNPVINGAVLHANLGQIES